MPGRILLPLFSLALLAACSKSKPTEPTLKAKEPVRKIDACLLLTSSELESLQGEPLQQTISSQQPDGPLTIAQCYFTLPNNTNSVVLTVTQRGTGPRAKEAREYWEETFGEREKAQRRDREEEGELREGAMKLEGLGDEAFWVGGRMAGALYVLKGETCLRISTGGPDQLERAKKLAEMVLAKL